MPAVQAKFFLATCLKKRDAQNFPSDMADAPIFLCRSRKSLFDRFFCAGEKLQSKTV
jgi:hypothetical protein